MNTRPLLIELITEELPPKALDSLGKAFAKGIRETLEGLHLLAAGCNCTDYATPRRLAVYLDQVLGQAPEQKFTEKLMPVSVGLDAQGRPSQALLKRLQARGLEHLDPARLERRSDGKQEMLYAHGSAAGASLAEGLQQAIEHTIAQLPIPKVMQYQLADGHTSVRFVRPAHHLLALWGDEIVPVKALGLNADRITRGHRFMCPEPLQIKTAAEWKQKLDQLGHVIPGFAERRRLIAGQLEEAARRVACTIGQGPEIEALLDEVCALVEYPTVYMGVFEKEFLSVPPECLILTMRQNQKYFPLFEPDTGALTHRFLIVSNMQPDDPGNIIQGNQRVIRPRLSDAQFFYQTDLKTPLMDRVADLDRSVYHNKLGSQLERTERVRKLTRWLATVFGGNIDSANSAAWLAKADLGTEMVGEFPELQGIMGAYYAAHDQESPDVVLALREQYRIRLDKPVNSASLTAAMLFMAERAETLAGIWGIGLVPTGERDPYGLRRAALGLISAYEQLAAGAYLQVSQDTPANLKSLLEQAAAGFEPGVLAPGTVSAVLEFVYERYRNQLATRYPKNVIDAVLALQPPLHQVLARIQACDEFSRLPEAEALAAANKRVGNLLKKAGPALPDFDPGLLAEAAEHGLANAIEQLQPLADAELRSGNFTAALAILARAREAVDRFFTDVMVMAEDTDVRNNRLALLHRLHGLMNQVADLSRLAQ